MKHLYNRNFTTLAVLLENLHLIRFKSCSFPQDVQVMKSIPVFPELLPPDNRTSQSSLKKSVADFLPIEKLERWAAHCTEIFKHFNSKLHVVTEAVQQIQNGYQLAVDTYTEMFAEESQIRMIGYISSLYLC